MKRSVQDAFSRQNQRELFTDNFRIRKTLRFSQLEMLFYKTHFERFVFPL